MKPETKFDIAKIQAAILRYDEAFGAFDEAYTAFETAYIELKEYTEGAKERLRQQRERNHARIHELELLLVGSPSQRLRDVEAKIKLKREKLNANWVHYNPMIQRSIDDFEAERAHLLDEISRTPSTPEERELEALRSYKYTVTAEEKEQIEWLYNVAMHKHKELSLAKEHLVSNQKETAKEMEQQRSELTRLPLLNMGSTYVNSIKKEADTLCEEV